MNFVKCSIDKYVHPSNSDYDCVNPIINLDNIVCIETQEEQLGEVKNPGRKSNTPIISYSIRFSSVETYRGITYSWSYPLEIQRDSDYQMLVNVLVRPELDLSKK